MKLSTGILLRHLLSPRRSVADSVIDNNIFRGVTYEHAFIKLQKAGVTGIELLIPRKYNWEGIQKAKEILTSCGMEIYSIHQQLHFVTTMKLAEIEELFVIAKELKAKVITLHINDARRHIFKVGYIEAMRNLEKQYKIVIAYENGLRHLLSYRRPHVWKPTEFPYFVTELGFHMTLDTTHLGQTGGDIVQFYKEHKKKVINIHLSDYRSPRVVRSFRPIAHSHLPIGEGKLPIKEFIKALKEENYKGMVTMEIHNATLDVIVKNAKKIKKMFNYR